MISYDVQLYYRHLMHPDLYGPAEPTTKKPKGRLRSAEQRHTEIMVGKFQRWGVRGILCHGPESKHLLVLSTYPFWGCLTSL